MDWRKRSIEEIMEDYYSDPWETLLKKENGKVVYFKIVGGREFYVEEYINEYGEINLPKEMEDKLKSMSIEKQLDYFRIVSSITFSKISYGEISKEQILQHSTRLQDYENIIKLVTKDEVLVGARIRGWFGDAVVLPKCGICTYYASDNDGSGSNDREDYDYLLCVDCE